MAEASSDPRDTPRRVVIFNVKYSPNLGDGVIAECLEHGLATRLPGAAIQSIDLAGRQGWTAPSGAGRRVRLLTLLQGMPAPIRDALVGIGLGIKLYRSLLPQWRRTLRGADFAVFGGGQLIQDGDLNFPLKLAGAAGLCRADNIPTAVFGIGVSASRSGLGRSLLRRLLASPTLVQLSVRDEGARASLASYAPSLPAALARDPGLLAGRLWPRPRPVPRVRPLAGVCVTHPVILRHHGQDLAPGDAAQMGERYGVIVDGLVDAGFDVLLFTNGAAEDEAFLAATAARLHRRDPVGRRVALASRAATPRELAALIAGLDGLVAHRLHAVILAYAYRIPAIGLRWDGKLDAFLRAVGQDGQAAEFDETGIAAVPARLTQAIAMGIDPARHACAVGEAEQGLDRLAGAILAAGSLRTRADGARATDALARQALALPRGS